MCLAAGLGAWTPCGSLQCSLDLLAGFKGSGKGSEGREGDGRKRRGRGKGGKEEEEGRKGRGKERRMEGMTPPTYLVMLAALIKQMQRAVCILVILTLS